MRERLHYVGRKKPNAVLSYWKDGNRRVQAVSLVPFNTVANAVLSAQASSASTYHRFSNLDRLEGRQCHSLMSNTLEMKVMIRAYVLNELG